MFLSRHQTTQQNQWVTVANKSPENVAKLKYLRTTVTNQNCIHDKIKTRQNSGNSPYHAVHNILSSRLLSKNVKMKIQKILILPVVVYGCETQTLTLRDKTNSGCVGTGCVGEY
jgi:hypothetical protein